MLVTVLAPILVAAGFGASTALANTAPEQALAAAASETTSPPEVVDRVSAVMQARNSGHEVEITGDRTETATTWALPSGTFRTEVAGGAIRIRDSAGDWTPVDYTLISSGTGWAPVASPDPVQFSNGGTGAVAMIGSGTDAVSLTWPAALPEPVIDGATATYKLSSTELLRLTATSTGYEQSVVLTQAPATAPQVTLRFRGRPKLAAADDGGFEFTTPATTPGDDPDPVLSVASPVMYSAATDPETGDHTQIRELTATAKPASGGSTVMDLSAGMDFLTDPATVYPVTIDPVIASVSPVGDTYVRQGDSSPKVNTYDLFAGPTSTGVLQRALLRFSAGAAVAGTHVTNATLNLYTLAAETCTAKPLSAYPVTADYTIGQTVWSNQPAVSTAAGTAGSASFSHGFTGCARAWDSINITNMAQSWANTPSSDYGLELQGDEADNASGKRFCSMDVDTSGGSTSCATTANLPYLSVTYNTVPATPTGLTWSPHVIGLDSARMSTSLTPAFSAAATNGDGTNYRLQVEVSHDTAYPSEGSGVIWTGTSIDTTPAATATMTAPSGTFTAGWHITFRTRSVVTNGAGGTDASPWTATGDKFFFNINAPNAPSISCPSYPANTWTTQASGSITCSISSTSTDTGIYSWSLDDPTPSTDVSVAPNWGSAGSITFTPGEGSHALYARARDTALHDSAITSYIFGVGKGGILTPKANAQTSQSVGLNAQSTSSYTTFRYEYQAGTGSSTWTQVPFANVYPVGSSTAITAWPAGTVAGAITNYPQLNWNVAATLAAAGKPDGAVQLRICFNPSGTPWCSSARTFLLAKTAFSGTSATSTVGPGTVSLVTGDFAVDKTDASFGGMTVGRTNTNLSPPAAAIGPSGVFGAGWTTAALGPDAGGGMFTLNDNSVAGSVTLADSSGTKLIYAGTSGGTFTGIGDAADGSTLVKSGGTWQLTDIDGTITTWSLMSGTTYVVSQVQQPGTEGLTTFTPDGTKRVTQIIAPAPTGITCTSASLVKGCRALLMTYATATTATGTAEAAWGDYTGLIQKIDYKSWDPATSAMLTTSVASYLYDNTGHLRGQWDPRISPALKTRYTYDSNGRLATETSPGRAAWTMAYDTAGKLASVSRPDPVNGVATQAIAYGVPLSGSGLPDVTATTAAAWNQTTDQAYTGTAVFPASKVPTVGAGAAYAPAAAEWPYAELTYVDVNGRGVNSASFGAGAWQISTTRYDEYGNSIWSLSARNRSQALTPSADTDPYTASQSTSAARADLLAAASTYTTDGVDLLTTLSTAHPVYLSSGLYASVRLKTTNTYDEGSPAGATYHLVTTTKDSPVSLDGTAVTAGDTHTLTTAYDPIDGASSTGNTSGWLHRVPTSSTTVMGTGPGLADIVKKIRYDSSGRVVESRMPESSGVGAGTTINVYYTADASAPVTACQNHAEWAGLLCQSGPQSQPAGTSIPVTSTTYNRWDQLLLVTEASGTSTRTTTNGYDNAGRSSAIAITASPAADVGTATPAVTMGYDNSTGDAVSVTNGSTTITNGLNSIGEVTSYTDADSQSTTSTYDIDGNVKTVNDGRGAYTYTYDGTDAVGAIEHRGLVTGLNVGLSGSPSAFTAAYDSDGNLTTQIYPGGLRQRLTYDNTGGQRSMAYDKSGTTWMTFGSRTDMQGRISSQASPGSSQRFGYDNNERLTNVQDIVAGQCDTRQYSFTKNGNRASLIAGAPASDGTCQTSSTTTASTSYDTGDRDTNTGYTYDKFRRTLTIPGADIAGSSALTAGYYSNDMVASQTQGTKTKNFTLDPSMRLRQATDTTSGTETRRTLNHYSNSEDNPSWISTSADAGSTWTWQRNIAGIDGKLAILQGATGTPQIQLTNPHGDVVAALDDTTTASSISHYYEQTEYGTARITNSSNPERYGWLGAAQRSSDALAGIVLMGVRQYNPNSGRFLSADSVVGGNENAYDYPNDPVGMADLDGRDSGDNSPKVMRACLSYGAIRCGKIVKITNLARDLAESFRPTKGGSNARNAVRHFVWQVAMTIIVGRSAAAAMGDAHEADDKNKAQGSDSWRDQRNNAYSRQWAADHSSSLEFKYLLHGLTWLCHYLYYRGVDLYNAGKFTRL